MLEPRLNLLNTLSVANEFRCIDECCLNKFDFDYYWVSLWLLLSFTLIVTKYSTMNENFDFHFVFDFDALTKKDVKLNVINQPSEAINQYSCSFFLLHTSLHVFVSDITKYEKSDKHINRTSLSQKITYIWCIIHVGWAWHTLIQVPDRLTLVCVVARRIGYTNILTFCERSQPVNVSLIQATFQLAGCI